MLTGLQRVEHAGYTRFILSPKPPRINAEGEELVDSETDEEADAMAVEMDPYSGIDLTGMTIANECAVSSANEKLDRDSWTAQASFGTSHTPVDVSPLCL